MKRVEKLGSNKNSCFTIVTPFYCDFSTLHLLYLYPYLYPTYMIIGIKGQVGKQATGLLQAGGLTVSTESGVYFCPRPGPLFLSIPRHLHFHDRALGLGQRIKPGQPSSLREGVEKPVPKWEMAASTGQSIGGKRHSILDWQEARTSILPKWEVGWGWAAGQPSLRNSREKPEHIRTQTIWKHMGFR